MKTPLGRAFARLLLQSPARLFTVNRAHADLQSRGLRVSKESLHALLDHFQDAYLVFAIPVFKKSVRAQATNPRKLYAIDPGRAAAMSHVTAEVRALVEAMAETKSNKAEIVTLHEEETVKTAVGRIRVVPAWRWLLEDREEGGR